MGLSARLTGLRALVALSAIAVSLAVVSSTSAATLIGDYQFQGNRVSSGPGPELSEIGTGGANTFQTENVMGVSRQVLAFPQHNGFRMSPVGLSPSFAVSVVATFRFQDVSGYRRLLDLSDGATSSGYYVHDGKLVQYDADSDSDVASSGPVFSANGYTTVAIAQQDDGASLYANGAPVATSGVIFNVISDALRFFKDNPGGIEEDSAGAVSCIRVYEGELTAAEVATIGASPTCDKPPTLAAPPAAPPAAGPTGRRAAALKKCKKKHGKARKKCRKRAKKLPV
jgi:hypothetical protein